MPNEYNMDDYYFGFNLLRAAERIMPFGYPKYNHILELSWLQFKDLQRSIDLLDSVDCKLRNESMGAIVFITGDVLTDTIAFLEKRVICDIRPDTIQYKPLLCVAEAVGRGFISCYISFRELYKQYNGIEWPLTQEANSFISEKLECLLPYIKLPVRQRFTILVKDSKGDIL